MSKHKGLLRLNKFYDFFNGPKHTALVYKRDKNKKTYTAIKFGSTKNKDMIEIKPIDGKKTKFVHKRPFEGKRSDFGNRPLTGMSIDPVDKTTIEQIKKRKPHKTAKAKKIY